MLSVSILGCLAALAAASPIHHDASLPVEDESRFTLRQVENVEYNDTETGLDARLWAYVKYNAHLPDSLQEAVRMGEHVNARFRSLVSRDEDGAEHGTVLAFPPQNLDIQYVVPVQIGQPEQTVFLNLDTGSGDLWTFSSETPRSQVRGQAIYDPSASNTSSLQDDQTWRIRYGDGSGASGVVYNDRVAIGATSFSEQAVESATKVSGSFTRDAFSSGILGLGFGRGNTVEPAPVKTYFENIMPALAAPLFTSNLQAGRPGNYNFGYISPREFTGDITYAPVSRENPYWEVSVDGVRIGDGDYEETELLERVVVDTGTTLILIDDELVEAYYDEVEGAAYARSWGGFVFPCDAELPDWYFGIGAYRGRVPGDYINYNEVNGTHCFGGIQSSAGIPFHLFGAVLLKAQFAVFDYVDVQGRAPPRVGFANKKLD